MKLGSNYLLLLSLLLLLLLFSIKYLDIDLILLFEKAWECFVLHVWDCVDPHLATRYVGDGFKNREFIHNPI